MDYNFDSLGSRNFEHLAQALASKELGPKLTVYGDGADGGREAVWTGAAKSLGTSSDWNGYGVVQAKYKQFPSSVADNAKWLKAAISAELKDWVDVEKNRQPKPEFLLFVSNVRLSAVPKNGRDDVEEHARQTLSELGLPVRDMRIWDAYDLTAILDNAQDIRNRYVAFLTPGDLIAQVLQNHVVLESTFAEAMFAYTARALRDESALNMSQAGAAGDSQATIDQVFVDLPAALPPRSWMSTATPRALAGEPIEGPHTERSRRRDWRHISEFLIHDFNSIPNPHRDDDQHIHRTVLVGGPGQGKSTVTQWIAQLYRSAFIRGSDLDTTPEISTLLSRVEKRRTKLGLPVVTARRWPFRIVLTELADHLAKHPDDSLMHYIASKINRRSSIPITTVDLRNWLKAFPWIVFIDGLDEVPTSSNRMQVMDTLNNFFIDASVLNADVGVVATTRPQGYGDEFSRRDYGHIGLQPLNVSDALAYAEGLVNVRMGEDTPGAEKVMARLVRASAEEHTKNLFESPLQVTILEVLLERLSKPPSDRSRLYSSYYKVILEREQEKSGELSDLLQRFEADVNYLHRSIGYLLQERGSEVGETTASLTSDEFEQLIIERFRSQGHSETDVQDMATNFSRLVTDRLVFLAKVEALRIGFELRSLQEYMASEHMTNLEERAIIPAIRTRALSPFWRNVVLFAAGTIFATKEHLRAEVVVLCEQLNSADRATAILLPGSKLALDILKDGSCLSMPIYSHVLAANALRLLDAPQGDSAIDFTALRRPELVDLLWRELESTTPSSTTRVLNALLTLDSLADDNELRSTSSMNMLISASSSEIQGAVVSASWTSSNVRLATIAAPYYQFMPLDNLYGHQNLGSFEPEVETETETDAETTQNTCLPAWLRHLSTLTNSSGQFEFSGEESALQANTVPLKADTEAWEWLASQATSASWAPVIANARFSAHPTADRLAAALEASPIQQDYSLLARTPWPLFTCVRYIETVYAAEGHESADVFRQQLVKAIRDNQLGTIEHWMTLQEAWSANLSVDDDFVDRAVSFQSDIIAWADLPAGAILPEAYVYTSTFTGSRSDDEDRASLLTLTSLLASNANRGAVWIHLALFLGSLFDKRGTSLPMSAEVSEERFALRQLLLLNYSGKTAAEWIPWLSLAPITRTHPSDIALASLGATRFLRGALDQSEIGILRDRASHSSDSYNIARLALVSDSSILLDMSTHDLQILLGSDDTVSAKFVQAAHSALRASAEEIWAGGHDATLRRAVDGYDDSLSTSWFTQLLGHRADSTHLALAARGAVLANDREPHLARQWLDLANRIFSDRGNLAAG
jgi:hypothetical protein